MKKSRDIIIATITALILLTGCGGNEIEHKQGNDKIEMSASQFIIDETPYAEDTEVTRSRNVANAPFGKEIIKLDNGIEAEVTVEREVADNTHHATTRATEMTNQHYTIYALKNGNRVGTLRGTVSGAGSSKKFIPDAGTSSMLLLEPGTYTFVCHNDQVTPTGNQLYVYNQDAEKALMGVTTTNVSGKEYKVNFQMKHLAARIRYELTTYWDINNIRAEVGPQGAIDLSIYNNDGTFNSESTGGVSHEITFPTVTTEAADYTYTSTSNYHYCLPNSIVNPMVIRFKTGMLYRKTIANYSMNLMNFPRQKLAANESYKVKIKLYYSFQYLFSDGTTGTIMQGKSAGKTPIAAMISSNKAIGLTDAKVGASRLFNWSNNQAKHNTITSQIFSVIYNSVDGYNQTWSTTHSATGVAHANDPNFPAFVRAANYVPLTPITAPAGKLSNWYLPALGEWKLAAQTMGKYNPAQLTAWPTAGTHLNWDDRLVKVIFVQAGGESPIWVGGTQGDGWYWASDEFSAGSAYHMVLYPEATYSLWFAANPKSSNPMRVRAFIIKNP